ncbi:MAG: hypothetical protein BYD32DRAFT_459541 [Podila humilis]|nr:MAG: hypothetical protein BYD32DRAFT_459541 [Podila humilis]
MAKKRITTTTRRTRQQSALDKNTSTGSDRQSTSSSPSPECHSSLSSSSSSSPSSSALSSRQQSPMPLHRGRKKSTPVRSPAQGDTSKAVVHADGYNLQNDPSHAVDMAMALDVAMLPSLSSYAPQQFQSGTSANSTLSRHRQQQAQELHQISLSSDASTTTTTIVAGSGWTSDPSLYKTKSVVDLSRNLLILHSRRPELTLAPSTEAPRSSFHPYARTHAHPRSSNRPSLSRSSSHSLAFTPSLTHSSPPSPSSSTATIPSLISSAEEQQPALSPSSSSSSLSSSPPTPTDQVPTGMLGGGPKGNDLLCLASNNNESLPFPSRFLNVRGLGVQGRRMQVILV